MVHCFKDHWVWRWKELLGFESRNSRPCEHPCIEASTRCRGIGTQYFEGWTIGPRRCSNQDTTSICGFERTRATHWPWSSRWTRFIFCLHNVDPEALLLARVPIYGLSDSGRGFWLRLDREAKAVGFKASNIFPSFYFFPDPKEAGECLALITTHVDDLLIAQKEKGKAAVERLLNKFEMGSLEHSSFRYCGKQFVQNEKEVSIDVSDNTRKVKLIRVSSDRKLSESLGPKTSPVLGRPQDRWHGWPDRAGQICCIVYRLCRPQSADLPCPPLWKQTRLWNWQSREWMTFAWLFQMVGSNGTRSEFWLWRMLHSLEKQVSSHNKEECISLRTRMTWRTSRAPRSRSIRSVSHQPLSSEFVEPRCRRKLIRCKLAWKPEIAFERWLPRCVDESITWWTGWKIRRR